MEEVMAAFSVTKEALAAQTRQREAVNDRYVRPIAQWAARGLRTDATVTNLWSQSSLAKQHLRVTEVLADGVRRFSFTAATGTCKG